MKSRFLLALLSVSALVPTAAMAQAEPELRGPRGGRERVERSPGGETPGARAEFRNDIRVEAPQPRPERPRMEQQRIEPQRGGDAPRWQDRGDRSDRGGFDRPRPPRGGDGQVDREALRRDWQQGNRGDRGGWQGRPDAPRPDRDFRTPPRDAQGQIDREALRRDWPRTDGRGQLERDRNDQWRREQWRREQQNGGWDRDTRDRGWDRNDWNRGDRNWDRGNRWERGGQWDRGWRRDDRYDWNRYRQQNRGLYRLPRYYAPSGWSYGYRRFGVGVRLNSFLFGSNYWINDPFYYRLPEVWGSYRWVRYYNDALLVDVRSGQVVDVEYDIFW